MKILFIGDIVGSPGRQIVKDRLAGIVAHKGIDLVLANCENSASGFGITPKLVEELLDAGVEVLTSGNHIFDRKEILDYFAPAAPRELPARKSRLGRFRGHGQERHSLRRAEPPGARLPARD
jgi:calcineurin-like phosphoesterase